MSPTYSRQSSPRGVSRGRTGCGNQSERKRRSSVCCRIARDAPSLAQLVACVGTSAASEMCRRFRTIPPSTRSLTEFKTHLHYGILLVRSSNVKASRYPAYEPRAQCGMLPGGGSSFIIDRTAAARSGRAPSGRGANYMILAFFVGSLGGIAFAVALQWRNKRIRRAP